MPGEKYRLIEEDIRYHSQETEKIKLKLKRKVIDKENRHENVRVGSVQVDYVQEDEVILEDEKPTQSIVVDVPIKGDLLARIDGMLNTKESQCFLESQQLTPLVSNVRQSVHDMDIKQLDEVKKMYAQLDDLKGHIDETAKRESETQRGLMDKIEGLIQEADSIIKDEDSDFTSEDADKSLVDEKLEIKEFSEE